MEPNKLRDAMAALARKYPDADTIWLMVVAYNRGVENAAQAVEGIAPRNSDETISWNRGHWEDVLVEAERRILALKAEEP